MTYKLLIVKNRYTSRFDIKKCAEWFEKNLNLIVTADEINTDFDVDAVEIGNATYKGVIVGKSIVEKLKTVVPEGKYNAVVFVYGNPMPGIRLNSCNGIGGRDNLYLNTEIIQVLDSRWEILNHEMFHAFFAKANRFGAGIVDNMDTYFRDGMLDLNQGETNRTIALRSLAPHWATICALNLADSGCKPGYAYSVQTGAKCPTQPQNAPNMPLVTLVRSPNNKETPGLLTVMRGGAAFSCKTLELPWLDNRKNVSCIPTGTYQVTWTFSPARLKWTYRLQNVPGRSGILLHAGNYAWGKKIDIQGCILLGSGFADINADGTPDIINSTITLKAFEGFMGKQPFTLVIK